MKPVIQRVLTVVLLLLFAVPIVALQKDLLLFTDDEADKLRVEHGEWEPVPRARSAPMGPHIVVEAPRVVKVDGGEAIETASPTDMTVQFQENQAPVNMSTLEISAKKGPFSKSLTEMLRPYVAGTTLAVEDVEVPSGSYQILIVVEDLEGRETRRTYRLIVDD